MKFTCEFFNPETEEIREMVVQLAPDEVRAVGRVRQLQGDAIATLKAQAFALTHAYSKLDRGFIHVKPPEQLPASPLQDFVAEMRGVNVLPSNLVDQIEAVLQATKTEARTNSHAKSFLGAVTWIVSHTERSIVERLEQLQRLVSFKGPVVMSMTALTGWK